MSINLTKKYYFGAAPGVKKAGPAKRPGFWLMLFELFAFGLGEEEDGKAAEGEEDGGDG